MSSRPRIEGTPLSSTELRLGDFVRRRYAAPSPALSWAVFERLGGILAFFLARRRTSPAVVTALSGGAGIAGAVVLATATGTLHQVAACALLLLSYTLDCTDGQLARATGRASALGAWLDVAVDAVVVVFVAAALCLALAEGGAAPTDLLLAGGYGASRVVSLLASTQVRQDGGGLHLTGARQRLRTVYLALIDTPLVYIALTAARPVPLALTIVIVTTTVLTSVQAVVSARHHFATSGSEPRGDGRRT